MFVLKTTETIIVWQKNAEMWWVSLAAGVPALVGAPFGKSN